MGKVKHYNKYPIETIDMMIAIWGEAKVAEWCLLTAFKYRMRLGLKQSETIESDMKKEDYYIEKYKELRGCIIEDEFAENLFSQLEKEEKKQQRYITFTDKNNRIAVSDETQLFKVLLADMEANENINYFKLKAGMFNLDVTKTFVRKYEDFNLIEIINLYSVNKAEFELLIKEKEIEITPVYYSEKNKEVKNKNK